MEEITLFCRLLLGFIFVSSFLSKYQHRIEHGQIVQEYKVIPDRMLPIFVPAELGGELICSLMMLLGVLLQFGGFLSLLLLTAYTTAILVNLFRGRNEISCGCGGVLGNHHLSWWLVLRNFILGILSILVISSQSTLGSVQEAFQAKPMGLIFGSHYWITLMGSVVVLMIFLATMEIKNVKSRIKMMLKDGE